MRQKIAILLFMAILLIPQFVFAGAGTTSLTNIRWANHVDAATGALSFRMVVDVSGPVQAAGTIVSTAQPRLVVDIKNAAAGRVGPVSFDGKIASKVNVVSGANAAKLVIDLADVITASNFKVFTLPSDSKNNKPYRVVVDISKPIAKANFSYSAGLAQKTIVLDPGHGGSDPGAIGPGKNQEKTVTLAVAAKVKAMLERAGAKVILTRDTDVDVYGPNASGVEELGARADVANSRKADIFLSIHANSFTNPAVNGAATYYYEKSDYDALLAQSLQTSFVQATNLQDRGTYQANFYVIKHTTMPAALIELAFISNPEEEKDLINSQFQQKMANGIVQGLDSFFLQAASRGGNRS
ncbi:MAG: N-acetylmuramoyl-L-alanine amidase [Sporomusaceae bacterium]|nr:N-acetylmuramoyl-L-alanine amidase [Sporomusaceae bacterium]